MNFKYDKNLIQRFCKDYDLPINIFDPEIFFFFFSLYSDSGIFPSKAWYCMINTIVFKYDGCVSDWLDYCQSVRDNAIASVKNSEGYKEFNECDMKKYAIKPPVGEHSCYTNETNGCVFLSIDLRKANFQALKYVGVLQDDTYEDFIKRAGGDDYIKDSKYLRQVIFGNCNPSRQATIERFLINKVYEFVRDNYEHLDGEVYSMNSEEVVFKIGSPDRTLDFYRIENAVKENLNLNVKVDLFVVEKLDIRNVNNDSIDAYVKRSLLDGSEKLKKVSSIFYPQVFKLWKGLYINATDTLFYFEHQLASFKDELRIVK